MAEVAPYGSWRSPIDPASIARGGRRLGFPELAADGAVWWLEGRAAEGGRSALMRRPAGGEPEEVTPPGANVRTRVHEYGGGAWKLLAPELVVYVESPTPLDVARIARALGDELTPAARPHVVRRVTKMPLTEGFQPDRRALEGGGVAIVEELIVP